MSAPQSHLSTCIGCGCDDLHACRNPFEDFEDTPCSWIRIDRDAGVGVCSECPEDVARWDAGDRKMKVPA